MGIASHLGHRQIFLSAPTDIANSETIPCGMRPFIQGRDYAVGELEKYTPVDDIIKHLGKVGLLFRNM